MRRRNPSMIGRSYNNEPKQVDPELVKFARYAASLIALQAPDALEDVSGQGFRSPQDRRRGHHFEGTAYAQRALRSPHPKTDTTFEYLEGNITDAKRGNGIKFPKIGREHLLVMQGVHRVTEPVGKVAYQLKAGLDDGEIEMAVLAHIGSQPRQEALTGVEAWRRAIPLLEDLPGTFEGKDPYRVRGPEEPAFPTFRHEISERTIAPILQELSWSDPDFQKVNPYRGIPHHPGK